MSKNENHYVHNDLLRQYLQKWIDTNEVCNEFVDDMYKVADKYLRSPKFRQYPQPLKDEMKQEAVLKMFRNLKNMKIDGNLFAYLTMCANSAFVTYLKKHYKYVNVKQDLYERQNLYLQSELPRQKCTVETDE